MYYKTTKTKKQSRTLPVRGNPYRGARSPHAVGEDYGRYFRCWNCGFPCDSERDSLGGSESRANVKATAYTQEDEYGEDASHCQVKAGATETVCEAAGGTWSSSRYEPVVTSGCPFCGTLNWRGDY